MTNSEIKNDENNWVELSKHLREEYPLHIMRDSFNHAYHDTVAKSLILKGLIRTPEPTTENDNEEVLALHLRTILPLARGYAKSNDLGNNVKFIKEAEEALLYYKSSSHVKNTEPTKAENGLRELGVLEVLNIIAKDPTQCTDDEIEKANKLCDTFGSPKWNRLVPLDECKIQRILANNKKLIFSERYLLSKEICETFGPITKEQLLAILPEKIDKVPGMGCSCLALGECECGCDADWTDYETWNKYHDIMKQRIEELFK